MKRSPIRRGTTPIRRKSMNRGKSPKLSDFDAEFETAKRVVRARSRGVCETADFCLAQLRQLTQEPDVFLTYWDALLRWRVDRPCEFRAGHVHHRRYRSRGGTNSLDNLIDLCLGCHQWVHAHGGFGQAANVLRLALSAEESEGLRAYEEPSSRSG
jgi:HNH endonuclease